MITKRKESERERERDRGREREKGSHCLFLNSEEKKKRNEEKGETKTAEDWVEWYGKSDSIILFCLLINLICDVMWCLHKNFLFLFLSLSLCFSCLLTTLSLPFPKSYFNSSISLPFFSFFFSLFFSLSLFLFYLLSPNPFTHFFIPPTPIFPPTFPPTHNTHTQWDWSFARTLRLSPTTSVSIFRSLPLFSFYYRSSPFLSTVPTPFPYPIDTFYPHQLLDGHTKYTQHLIRALSVILNFVPPFSLHDHATLNVIRSLTHASFFTPIHHLIAKYVKERIKEFAPTATKPFVLGLPTGSSPVGVYRNLVKFHQAGELSFQHIITFNMDEYVGLPR